jgi:radical SAM superfamily enzyme YgiQ (UPF0313 family)
LQVVLISTYELGRQPFGLASPAAWLRAAGHTVTQADVSIRRLPEQAVRDAGFVGFYLPMHTAARLAAAAIPKVRKLNPRARLCCYGIYAPLNEEYLRSLGVEVILGGEFEAALVAAVDGEAPPAISMDRLPFVTPDRTGLPALERYSQLHMPGEARAAGYTEASRGCKHLCRHCPIVPVYNGTFRVVPVDVVLQDIRNQVQSGAAHITFGDPDFFNGPGHAVKITEALHAEFPSVTYDVTIKVEHLRRHSGLLPGLKATGCLFLTTAAESFDDAILARLAKGHARADFVQALDDCRAIGLSLAPTFIAFTPWTTLDGYREMLRLIAELGLVDQVSSVQLALRLLIPAGSRMLELEDVQQMLTGFDEAALLHRWKHPDPAVDRLAAEALRLVNREQRSSRREVFQKIWHLAHGSAPPENFDLIPRAAIPYMDEPWYC